MTMYGNPQPRSTSLDEERIDLGLQSDQIIAENRPHDHKLGKYVGLKLDFEYLKFYWTHCFNNLYIICRYKQIVLLKVFLKVSKLGT